MSAFMERSSLALTVSTTMKLTAAPTWPRRGRCGSGGGGGGGGGRGGRWGRLGRGRCGRGDRGGRGGRGGRAGRWGTRRQRSKPTVYISASLPSACVVVLPAPSA